MNRFLGLSWSEKEDRRRERRGRGQKEGGKGGEEISSKISFKTYKNKYLLLTELLFCVTFLKVENCSGKMLLANF